MSALPSEASVVMSIAPKHYGVAARTIYDEKLDAGREKSWDKEDEQWRVSRMTWYIEKGEDLVRARKIDFAFYRTFEPNPGPELLQVTETLFECSTDDAPLHPGRGKSNHRSERINQVTDYRTSGITKNCVLTTDLSTIPKTLFKKKSRYNQRDGSKLDWWELHYKLLVHIQSGPMIFSLQCGGKEYGQATAEY